MAKARTKARKEPGMKLGWPTEVYCADPYDYVAVKDALERQAKLDRSRGKKSAKKATAPKE